MNVGADTESRKAGIGHIWEDVLDCLPTPVAIIGQDLRILFANRALAALTGASKEDLVGQEYYEVVHGDHGHAPDCPMVHRLTSRSRWELLWREPHLGSRWLHLIANPIEAPGAENVVIVLQDVTSQLRRQEQLEHIDELSRSLSKNLHLDSLLQLAISEIAGILADPTALAMIALCDESGSLLTIKAAKGAVSDEVVGMSIPPSELLPRPAGHAPARDAARFLARSDQLAPGPARIIDLANAEHLTLWPLVSAGRILGAFLVASKSAQPLHEDDLKLLGTYSRILSSALDNAGAAALTDAALHRMTADLEFLSNFLIEASEGISADHFSAHAAARIAAALGVQELTVYRYDHSNLRASIISAYPATGGEGKENDEVVLSQHPLLSKTCETGEPQTTDGATVFPLKSGRHTVGAMEVRLPSGRAGLSPEERRLARAIAAHYGMVIDRFLRT